MDANHIHTDFVYIFTRKSHRPFSPLKKFDVLMQIFAIQITFPFLVPFSRCKKRLAIRNMSREIRISQSKQHVFLHILCGFGANGAKVLLDQLFLEQLYKCSQQEDVKLDKYCGTLGNCVFL